METEIGSGVGNKLKGALGFLWSSYWSYYTARLTRVHDKRTVICFRLFQIIIIAYIIGWNIIYKRGYQEFDTVSSTITTKVKGLGFVNYNNTLVPRVYDNKLVYDTQNGSDVRIFDTADYIIPPSEYNSIFVMTNFVETFQKQGLCDEDYTKVDCNCTKDSDCSEKMVTTNTWNGIPTGRCIDSSVAANLTVCQIKAWCPVERETKDTKLNLIQNVGNFTIFIKNDIQFKLFNKQDRNVLPNISNDFITTCVYAKVKDIKCPVFLIKEILDQVETNPKEKELMLQRGAVILIEINWICNYDVFWNPCSLSYKFTRYDLPFQASSGGSGFNFRFADKFVDEGEINRILIKAYGLRFVIAVNGKAGKFNAVPTLITIGSGLGLLTVATVVADIVLASCAKNRKAYQRLKILDGKHPEKLVNEIDAEDDASA